MAYTAKVKALIGISTGLGLVVLVLAIIVLVQTIIKQNLELKTKQTKLTNNQTTEPIKQQIKCNEPSAKDRQRWRNYDEDSRWRVSDGR